MKLSVRLASGEIVTLAGGEAEAQLYDEPGNVVFRERDYQLVKKSSDAARFALDGGSR